MAQILILSVFLCFLLQNYPLLFLSNYGSIDSIASKSFFPISLSPSVFSCKPSTSFVTTQDNNSRLSSFSFLSLSSFASSSPFSTTNSSVHTFFLGFKPSCNSSLRISSLLYDLGGEIIQTYPSIRVFYIRVPFSVSLHSLNSVLPCLEYIETPQQLEYQQIFNFGLGSLSGLSSLASGSGSGGFLSSLMPMMGLGSYSDLESLAASSLLGEDYSSFGPPPSRPVNYGPVLPPSHQAPLPMPPMRTNPSPIYSNPYTKTYPTSSSQMTSQPILKNKGALSDISVPSLTSTSVSSFTSFMPTSSTPIISTTTVTQSVILPTPLVNNNTTLLLNGTNSMNSSASALKYFDRNEWKEFVQNSSFPLSFSNASSINWQVSDLKNFTNVSTLASTSVRPNSLSKTTTNNSFFSVPIVREGDLFVENLTPQPYWPQGMDLWALDGLDGNFDGAYKYKYSGKGVHVYLVDSGVEYDHPGFEKGKVELMYSSSGILANGTRDCTGHGSHAAGLVAGKITGVAKDAYLHVLRVSGCEKEFTDKNILDALEYLSTKLQKPAVLSLTLLPLNSEVYKTSSLRNMLLRFINELQVPVIVPAGNRGTNKCSVFGETNGLISVGSHTRGLLQARFSNYGECSNIFAPGLNVWSHTNTIRSGPLYTSANGTSVSAPMTAGVVALMLEKEPKLSPIQIHQALLRLSSKTIKDNSNSDIPVLNIPLTSQSLESLGAVTNNTKNSNLKYWIIGGSSAGMIALGSFIGGFLLYRKKTQSNLMKKPSTSPEYKPNSQAFSIQFSEDGDVRRTYASENGYTRSIDSFTNGRTRSTYSDDPGHPRSMDYSEARRDMQKSDYVDDTICEGRPTVNTGYFVEESYIRPPRLFAESVRNST